jgi:hypothetical protein
MTRRSITAATILTLVAGPALAGAGENALAFLKVGVGTDAIGMGHAYASQVADASALYWNPAGLPRVAGTDVLLMHNEFIADLRTEYVAVARNFGRHGVGLSFNGLFTDDLEGRDENGAVTGDVGYYDLAFSVGYGYAITDAITAGVGVKYLREFIGDDGADEDHVAQGLATDLGVQYHTPRFAVGLAASNLGADIAFNQVQLISASGPGAIAGGTEFSLPTTVQGGVTYRPDIEVFEGGVEVALEGRQVIGEDFSTLFGVRYRYRNLAALSVGYRTGLDTEDLTFGLRMDKDQLRFGYAFVPFDDDLGDSHRISLGYHLN